LGIYSETLALRSREASDEDGIGEDEDKRGNPDEDSNESSVCPDSAIEAIKLVLGEDLGNIR
jgi:hypothetical protein